MAKKATEAEALKAAGIDWEKLKNLPWAQAIQFLMMFLGPFLAKKPMQAAPAGCTDLALLLDCNVHCAASALYAALQAQECHGHPDPPVPTP